MTHVRLWGDRGTIDGYAAARGLTCFPMPVWSGVAGEAGIKVLSAEAGRVALEVLRHGKAAAVRGGHRDGQHNLIVEFPSDRGEGVTQALDRAGVTYLWIGIGDASGAALAWSDDASAMQQVQASLGGGLARAVDDDGRVSTGGEVRVTLEAAGQRPLGVLAHCADLMQLADE